MIIILKPKIKVRLAELDMQQIQLAEKLGMTKQTINSYCRGASMPTLENSFRIAYILNCKVDDLFDYIDEDIKD